MVTRRTQVQKGEKIPAGSEHVPEEFHYWTFRKGSEERDLAYDKYQFWIEIERDNERMERRRRKKGKRNEQSILP